MKTILAALLLTAFSAQAQDTTISANGITIKACAHDAGAICSLTWNGREFIDDHDHGRQLQSAISFDHRGEGYNPTEAGASYLTDGYNPSPSSSALTAIHTYGSTLVTESRMAFWNPVKGVKTSDHKMRKVVTIGYNGMSKVIEYQTTFFAPRDHRHSFGQYEVLTGYMPDDFSQFYTLDMATGAVEPLTDGPGEQPKPIIFCTQGNTHCMGIYNPRAPQAEYADAGYGRWRYGPRDGVVKWNVVFRYADANIDRTFTSYVILGTLPSVKFSMRELHKRLVP